MRKIFPALGLLFALHAPISAPAFADELIVNGSPAAAVTLAQSLGYYDAAKRTITTAGKVAAGGDYFLNSVGTVYVPTGETTPDARGNPQPVMQALPGVWWRLRHNASSATLAALIAKIPANSGLTIYKFCPAPDINTQSFWSPDGCKTAAPDYVATIGVIM